MINEVTAYEVNGRLYASKDAAKQAEKHAKKEMEEVSKRLYRYYRIIWDTLQISKKYKVSMLVKFDDLVFNSDGWKNNAIHTALCELELKPQPQKISINDSSDSPLLNPNDEITVINIHPNLELKDVDLDDIINRYYMKDLKKRRGYGA